VRDRAQHQHINILENYIKLVTRCPELVIKYPWTDEGDKATAQRISESSFSENKCYVNNLLNCYS
jgi:hypothetical protein